MRALLQYCAGGRESKFAAGTQILREGEMTGRVYVLVDGQVDVVKDGTVVANLTEPGSILGEMSVLLGRPHSATVIAGTATTVYAFDDAATFLASQPGIALLVARTLALRLYNATASLADAKRQYAGLRGLVLKMRDQ
jgi:CRP/FNR family transcriptional regulator, cyclic AMP receptor protein